MSIALLACSMASGQTTRPTTAPSTPPATRPAADLVPARFERHVLVLLRRGDSAETFTPEQLARIQQQHLEHMRGLADAGKMIAAGPFAQQTDPSLRGLCVYRVETLEEARALAEQDPAVQAGRLKVDVLFWMTAEGAVAFPLSSGR